MKEKEQEFKFADKGWAWNDFICEAKEGILINTDLNSDHIIGGRYEVAIKGGYTRDRVGHTMWFKNFSYEKPEKWEVPDPTGHAGVKQKCRVRNTEEDEWIISKDRIYIANTVDDDGNEIFITSRDDGKLAEFWKYCEIVDSYDYV